MHVVIPEQTEQRNTSSSLSSQPLYSQTTKLSIAFSVIGGCLFSATMFSMLCCALFWLKKIRFSRKQEQVKHIPKTLSLPVIRSEDIIEFVLPAHSNKREEQQMSSSNSQPIVTRTNSLMNLSDLNLDLYNRGLVTNEKIHTEKAKVGISVQYDSGVQELYVKILGALNLPNRHKGTPPDPYIKATLLPEKQAKFTTKTLRSTSNPLFNEVFIFKVSALDFNDCSLKLSVRDRYDLTRLVHSEGSSSGLTSIRSTLGHAVIPLVDFDLLGSNEGRRKVMWCLLQQKTLKLTNSEKGDICVSLCYEQEASKISVLVSEARNLAPPHQEREKLIVKLLLYERKYLIAAHRSKGVRRTENPTLNVSFHFPLVPRALHEASCQIIIFSKTKIGTKRTLGRLTLGHRYFFTATNTWISSSGLDHWHDMEHRPGTVIQRWHHLQ